MFSPVTDWLIYELHLGILFLLKKLSESVFQTAFWVKKEFPNVTHKLISPPQAKNFSGKNTVAETSFLKFSQPAAGEKYFGKNTVAETSFPDEERKLSLRQKNWKFNFFLKNEKKKKQ